ncbi:MAG: PglZ domain-containing protein, partial [Bacteroidota bacterium]|nr:PglZ domain-containing protein [Bacteroidota bacterium]
LFFSILPTATMYARNAIFAGLMPSEIERLFPSYWINDDEEGNKNQFEQELFETQLQRLGRKEKFYFEKNTGTKSGKKTSESLAMINSAQLSILVYNFIDMISHARTEMEMIRELASDESAYRSITLSWFKHSPLFELLKELSSQKLSIVLLTDHGTIKVSNPVKIIGDRNTNTNLRYKVGKNLNYNSKQIFEVSHPKQIYLPSPNVSSSYVFALNEDFFAYPNNYNYYANYYRNTFQHGGISMEEMMVPVVTLRSKE